MREFCFWVQNLTNEEQVVVIQARTVLTLAEKVTVPVDAVGTGPGFPKPPFLARHTEDAHPGRRATGRWGWGPQIPFASGGLAHAQVSQHCYACLQVTDSARPLPKATLPPPPPRGREVWWVCKSAASVSPAGTLLRGRPALPGSPPSSLSAPTGRQPAPGPTPAARTHGPAGSTPSQRPPAGRAGVSSKWELRGQHPGRTGRLTSLLSRRWGADSPGTRRGCAGAPGPGPHAGHTEPMTPAQP